MDQFHDARAEREQRDRRSRPLGFEVLLRRFFRETQQSRILSIVKENRFRRETVSRQTRRQSAARKVRIDRVKRGW